jgi:hypothetical protein
MKTNQYRRSTTACGVVLSLLALQPAALFAEPSSTGAATIELSEVHALRSSGARDATIAFYAKTGSAYVTWAQESPPPKRISKTHHADPRLTVLLARSTDGGTTFEEPVALSVPTDRVTSAAVSAARVQVGPGGEVYVMYPRLDPRFKLMGMNIREQVRFRRSLDGARTFETPIEIGSEALEGVATSLGMVNLFAAPDGTLYASWLDTRATFAYVAKHHEWPGLRQYSSQLRVARSVDGGRSFESSVIAAAPVCVCCGTRVAQGATGPLYASTRGIAWPDPGESAESVRDLFVVHSLDRGSTWSAASKFHDDEFRINTCPDVSAGLAVDSAQRLHAAWYTGTAANPGMFYAVSSDQGQSFSAPIPLVTGEPAPYGGVKLAIDSHDNAWIAVKDWRPGTRTIHLLRVASDGTVSQAPPWPGKSPDIASTGDGVILTWTEARAGDEETAGGLYTRLARVASPQ